MLDTHLANPNEQDDRAELMNNIQFLEHEIEKLPQTITGPIRRPSAEYLSEIKKNKLSDLSIEELGRLKSNCDTVLDRYKNHLENEAQSKESSQEKLLMKVGKQDISTGQEYFSLPVWGLMQKMADTFIKSQALPTGIKNKEQLMMILQAGYEKGMKPMESIQSFAIVNGNITMFGSSVLNRLRRFGWDITWINSTDIECTMKISKGSETYTESYTINEAEKNGLTGKDNWKKYPRKMLRYKCAQMHTKFNVPEVMDNMYMTEEVLDFTHADKDGAEKKRAVKEVKSASDTIIDLP